MQLEITHMRSRLNYRSMALLLACGMTPLVVVCAVTYHVLSTELTGNAAEHLRASTQADAQLVNHRLQGLAATLRGPADSIPLTHGNVIFTPGAQDSRGYFDGVLVETGPNHTAKVLGSVPPPPELTAAQLDELRRGQAVTFLAETADPGTFFMVTSAKPGTDYPRTWGLARLRGALVGLGESAADDGFCVYAAGSVLHCRADADFTPVPAGATEASATMRWSNHGTAVTSAYARVSRDSASDQKPWYVVRTAPDAAALAPLAGLRSIIALGLALSVAGLLLIGHLTSNRRAESYAALALAAEQVRSGDYTVRLEEGRNREFETVAGSLNQMIVELDRHAIMAEGLQRVADAVLVERSTATLMTSVSTNLPELLNSTAVSVVAAVSDDPLHWRGEVTHHRNAPAPIDMIVAKATVGALRIAPEWSVISAGGELPEYCHGLDPQPGAAVVVFPLLRGGRPFGVLAAAQRPGVVPHPRLLASGRQFATQLARGLVNVATLEDLELQSTGTLTALARAIDASSRWTHGHSERVARTATEIARRVGLDERSQTLLRRGALVHDIGKLGLAATILDRPGQLTDEEQRAIETHPLVGAEMILMIPAFREIVPLVQHHHELLDGSGYPHGLRAERIPPMIRILTVADVYDALISDRPYREGMSPEGALGVLRRGAGTKFDEKVVNALESIVQAHRTDPDAAAPGIEAIADSSFASALAEVQQVG